MTGRAGLRAKLYRAFEPGQNAKERLSMINRLLVVLVLLSFVLLALETEPAIGDEGQEIVDLLNALVVLIFAIEYAIRLWIAGENPKFKGLKGRLRYMCSFYALADLFAFLPELLLILFAGDRFDAQTIALLKALRLLRLFKLTRYIPAFDLLGEAIKRAGGQLLTSLMLALALVYVSAIMLYMIEGEVQEEAFGSIPRAIWWAIATLTTVGYGDVYPVTPLGRVAASVIALAGIGLVALPAGVFASAFSDVLREESDRKKEEKAKRALTGSEPSSDEDTGTDG